MFNSRYIFKWLCFHCHVNFQGYPQTFFHGSVSLLASQENKPWNRVFFVKNGGFRALEIPVGFGGRIPSPRFSPVGHSVNSGGVEGISLSNKGSEHIFWGIYPHPRMQSWHF